MAINVRIPQPLRNLTGNQSTVTGEGTTLHLLVANLEGAYPGIKDRMLDEAGQIRRFVNIYVNGDDVRFMEGLGTSLKDGDEVSIVPAVAGG
jgi:molybdopterin synthase sulfur carrier subunit